MVLSEELLILASCLLRPMRRNSVLEEFNAVIHDDLEHSGGDLCWSRSESEGRKEKVECHLRRGEVMV